MDRHAITQHSSSPFNAELTHIHDQVLAMGNLVAAQLSEAIEALLHGDVETARRVVGSDHPINALERSIDDECAELIARRHPAAGDLRFVLAMTKTIMDLERMGDEAKRIGRMALELAPSEDPQQRFQELNNLGRDVLVMVTEALTALRQLDTRLAVRVVRADIGVDREYDALMRRLMTHMTADPAAIPRVLNVMWASRALERIGDRARNICEYVIYLVGGKDVRHTSLEELERQAHRRD